MSSNIKARIEVAEVVLKTLKIDYEIVPSKPHKSRLMFEKQLTQVHDILASKNNRPKIYAEQIKNDFEARRYWRKQFRKFHKLQKSHS
ncbi:MAG: hypothetical protein ACXAAH_06565 [Promethearchaeota archaeon]|jgi:hypothetical protein